MTTLLKAHRFARVDSDLLADGILGVAYPLWVLSVQGHCRRLALDTGSGCFQRAHASGLVTMPGWSKPHTEPFSESARPASASSPLNQLMKAQ